MKRIVVSGLWMLWIVTGILVQVARAQSPAASPVLQSLEESLGTPQAGSRLERVRGEGLGNTALDPASMLQGASIGNAGQTISNGIKGNAFSGDSGIVNVIQNTGNNVVIDSSVNLNLRFVK
ncbi:hypothetical protein ACSYAY_06750 [Leptospirillum ferriphilum]|jgi:hypothetical protein|uniref:Uncharacterized protein n=3 Tax=Leptospirillum TaxID=179 RepID=A0A094WEJ2_9BACT|nr:hypothetical protein [Leptospirillum ferriphilum]AFS54248.1 hypothetical protein LFML04_2052 [Leptospirillum ferriphilum ML-04]EDZ40360.1 MAG: Hypothetical protein CGL2_11346141 [Leptospirillum sp. Group II '5-way CG']KGA94037.1 hypothetical protein LptCag_0663 [Leptospirillum ferriphilum]MCL5259614.1 hypothetical protein [Nitrospirota bacterium]